ncbi:MAG TPA: glucose-1-phosphate adenylyltransferase [Pirellulales bacterium]|jgi:glucose-1-phosphate adenylyltransferase|nr:glucose-1-phosphate adenylyltransferase [Pirellulales bacterium]
MNRTLALVLGGGRGTRLYPLTKHRAKPAVPLAGKYRLIDIPLSNCINSGVNRIYVLTQFNSTSLHRHIRRTYAFDQFGDGFVEILAAQQTLEHSDWYQGTADAVRQNLRHLEQSEVDHVLILSGDQLYRMNFAEMMASHRQAEADVSIAGMPVDRETAKAMGIMRLDDTGRVAGFLEKPQTHKEMDMVRMDPAWIEQRGIPSRGRDMLASMGIYLFNRPALIDLLTKTDYHDFGREIFPAAVRTHRVHVHLFDGYWEDIGTIRSFYEANLAMAAHDAPFELVNGTAPIYTRARFLPPSRIDNAQVRGSLISDGCTIEAGTVIENSVVGLRCRIGRNVTIRNSILMGADFYDSDPHAAASQADGLPPLGIGAGSVIEGAIIDKNCRIGAGVRIANDAHLQTSPETPQAMVADGIIIVQKDAVLPDGWQFGQNAEA